MRNAQCYTRLLRAGCICAAVLISVVLIGGCGEGGGSIPLGARHGKSSARRPAGDWSRRHVYASRWGAVVGRQAQTGILNSRSTMAVGAIAGKHRVLISIPGPETPAPTGEEEAPVEGNPQPPNSTRTRRFKRLARTISRWRWAPHAPGGDSLKWRGPACRRPTPFPLGARDRNTYQSAARWPKGATRHPWKAPKPFRAYGWHRVPEQANTQGRRAEVQVAHYAGCHAL